jgi:ABC-type multidrug transport system ATPase subunit
MAETILEIKNVSKYYYSAHSIVAALREVTFSINRGEIVALLGVNGAGKTTLSSILATLHPPTTGDVLFEQESIYRNLAHYRRSIGFCPQTPSLDAYLTVQENLLFAGRYYLLDSAVIEERVTELMRVFNLEKYAHSFVQKLSGGYKQRLSIARALLPHPSILILDEPTVGLDPHIRRQLWEVIRRVNQQGMTIILTTHYLEEAETLADSVVIVDKGQLVLQEKTADLKKAHGKDTLEEVFLTLVRQEEDNE